MLETSDPTVEQQAAKEEAAEQRAAEQPVHIQRVGDIEVKPHHEGGYSVTIRLNAPPPDPEWVKLFEHPPVLRLAPPARRPNIAHDAIEVVVRNEEQMGASVRYAELAVIEANQVYNDEVLPRRERHRRLRDAARAQGEVGLDAMARAADTL